MKKLYLLDRKLKWKTFKELNNKLAKQSGIVCVELEKVLWQLLRENKIYCWFAEDMENDMGIGLKIPKRYKKWEVNIIKSNLLIIEEV